MTGSPGWASARTHMKTSLYVLLVKNVKIAPHSTPTLSLHTPHRSIFAFLSARVGVRKIRLEHDGIGTQSS